VKSLRQDVKQKTPDELVGSEGHRAIARLPAATVILVALLSASSQLQVDNPDVVACRRGSKARNQAGRGRVFLCETAARWARGTRSN
jgi:hypothetical protein